MTPGNFVGHHDPTGAILSISKNGVRRDKLRQPTNEAWVATNWDGLCGAPWQMVAPDLKLTKKVASDKEGAGPPLPILYLQ